MFNPIWRAKLRCITWRKVDDNANGDQNRAVKNQLTDVGWVDGQSVLGATVNLFMWLNFILRKN
jgi:hypothetical protein